MSKSSNLRVGSSKLFHRKATPWLLSTRPFPIPYYEVIAKRHEGKKTNTSTADNGVDTDKREQAPTCGTSIQKAEEAAVSSRLPSCTVIISNNSNKRLKRKTKRVVEETAQQ